MTLAGGSQRRTNLHSVRRGQVPSKYGWVPVRAQQSGHGTGQRADCHRPILQCCTLNLQTGLVRTHLKRDMNFDHRGFWFAFRWAFRVSFSRERAELERWKWPVDFNKCDITTGVKKIPGISRDRRQIPMNLFVYMSSYWVLLLGAVKWIKYTVYTGRVLLLPLPGNTRSSETCHQFESNLTPQIASFRRLRALWPELKAVFTRHNWT